MTSVKKRQTPVGLLTTKQKLGLMPNVACLGLDISTATGVTILRADGSGFEAVALKRLEEKTLVGMARVEALASSYAALLDQFAPDFVVLEGYGYANKFSIVTLVEVGTAFRLETRKRGIPMFSMSPNSLKKWVTGSGNAPKAQMLLAVFKRWGVEIKDDNIADAFGLAAAGLAFVNAIDCTALEKRSTSLLSAIN